MKSSTFNYNLLAIGIAAVLGLSTANAATTSGAISPTDNKINNTATATYKVGTILQPEVISNTVTVNISEIANFSLVSADNSNANKNISAKPGAINVFTHTLSNDGNVSDTYTIKAEAEDDAGIETANHNYLFTATDIRYTIQQKGGAALTTEQTAALVALGQSTATGTIVNGGTIKLLPGLEAKLSYDALTLGTQVGGNIGVGTLSATSSFITVAQPANSKLVNENQTKVKLPVFKIEKTAACQGSTPCGSFDLNSTLQEITYTIKVTNVGTGTVETGYTEAAKNFTVRDVLPLGMTLKGTATYPSGTTVTSNGVNPGDSRQIIDISSTKLAVNEELLISFTVLVDKSKFSTVGSATNHATVYAKYNGDTPNLTNPALNDIIDSTENVGDKTNVPAETSGVGVDTAMEITFTNRALSITSGTTQEIPVFGGEIKYTHTVTNNGNAPEGGAGRPIEIIITDPTPTSSNPLEVSNPYYKLPNGTEIMLVQDLVVKGKYTLPASVTIAPGDSFEIGYTVKSNGTNTDIIDKTSEVIKVKLTPQGTAAPIVAETSNTTSIKGLTLLKQAALDYSCNGVIDVAFTTDLTTNTAKPGDCILYKIAATNTFTGTALTDVTLSDLTSNWAGKATYKGGATSSAGSVPTLLDPNTANERISTTITSLAATETAYLYFSIIVKP